jgi:MFS transporter, ACS family, solute carrier family 17 (sodium-dependent inorganic phosphate cotransporter), other
MTAVRWGIAALLFSALFVGYSYRVIMSITIGAIAIEKGYNNAEKGLVLSAFFIGYCVLQIIGGWLTRRYGGWIVLGMSVLVSSVGVLITPVSTSSLGTLVAARILTGLGQSAFYPTVHGLLALWAPRTESSALVGLAWSGAYLGTAVALPVSGYLIDLGSRAGAFPGNVWVGWRGVFYVWGVVGAAFAVLWLLVGASSPEQHWAVSRAERVYIIGNRDRMGEKHGAVPWRRLLLHPAVVAMVLAQTGNNWLFYFLLSWM